MNTTPHIDIDFSYKEERWYTLDFNVEAQTQAAIAALLDVLQEQQQDIGSISVVLADNDFVQDLNKNYRNKDKPTNILSFPMDDDEMLGDLILAYETINCEASEQEKTLENHYKHLIIHGVLHLLGYDHIEDSDAALMERKEIEALKQLEIANPYN